MKCGLGAVHDMKTGKRFNRHMQVKVKVPLSASCLATRLEANFAEKGI
jgi:hypothetical protein